MTPLASRRLPAGKLSMSWINRHVRSQRMPTRRVLLVVALGTLVLAVGGCGKLFGPKPTNVVIELNAAQNLNPDVTGRASPLRVRLYELKSVSTFNKADIFSLTEKDNDLLGADLVTMEEIQVKPGMQQTLTRKFGPDSKFLAVLAPYRDWEHATWRASVEIPPGKTTTVALELAPISVSLSIKKK
jgi:type VI secretion system protein VasD